MCVGCVILSQTSVCVICHGECWKLSVPIEPVDGLALSCGPMVMSVYIVELCVSVGGILLLSGHELF